MPLIIKIIMGIGAILSVFLLYGLIKLRQLDKQMEELNKRYFEILLCSRKNPTKPDVTPV